MSDLLRQMSELEAEGQEESPWNSSFVAELARALQDAPGTEVVDDAPPANLGGKGSLEDLMLAAINERDVEDAMQRTCAHARSALPAIPIRLAPHGIPSGA